MRDKLARLLTALAMAGFVALLVAVPATGTGDRAAGQALFAKRCAACHGPTGLGNQKMAKALKKDLSLLRDEVAKKADAALLKSISEGRPPMPAFGKTLSADAVSDVLAYVRKLQGK